MKLKYDTLLSSFAFNLNLRPYVKDNARLTGVSDAMLKGLAFMRKSVTVVR